MSKGVRLPDRLKLLAEAREIVRKALLLAYREHVKARMWYSSSEALAVVEHGLALLRSWPELKADEVEQRMLEAILRAGHSLLRGVPALGLEKAGRLLEEFERLGLEEALSEGRVCAEIALWLLKWLTLLGQRLAELPSLVILIPPRWLYLLLVCQRLERLAHATIRALRRARNPWLYLNGPYVLASLACAYRALGEHERAWELLINAAELAEKAPEGHIRLLARLDIWPIIADIAHFYREYTLSFVMRENFELGALLRKLESELGLRGYNKRLHDRLVELAYALAEEASKVGVEEFYRNRAIVEYFESPKVLARSLRSRMAFAEYLRGRRLMDVGRWREAEKAFKAAARTYEEIKDLDNAHRARLLALRVSFCGGLKSAGDVLGELKHELKLVLEEPARYSYGTLIHRACELKVLCALTKAELPEEFVRFFDGFDLWRDGDLMARGDRPGVLAVAFSRLASGLGLDEDLRSRLSELVLAEAETLAGHVARVLLKALEGDVEGASDEARRAANKSAEQPGLSSLLMAVKEALEKTRDAKSREVLEALARLLLYGL